VPPRLLSLSNKFRSHLLRWPSGLFHSHSRRKESEVSILFFAFSPPLFLNPSPCLRYIFSDAQTHSQCPHRRRLYSRPQFPSRHLLACPRTFSPAGCRNRAHPLFAFAFSVRSVFLGRCGGRLDRHRPFPSTQLGPHRCSRLRGSCRVFLRPRSFGSMRSPVRILEVGIGR